MAKCKTCKGEQYVSCAGGVGYKPCPECVEPRKPLIEKVFPGVEAVPTGTQDYGTVAHVPVERVAMPEELEKCYRDIDHPVWSVADSPTQWEYYLPRCAPKVWPFLSVEQKATMYFMALAQAERFQREYNSVR